MHTQTYICIYKYAVKPAHKYVILYIPHIPYIYMHVQGHSRTNNAIDTHLYKLYYILVTFSFVFFCFASRFVFVFVLLFVILFSLSHINFV